jgi:phosphoribosyl 1,2-cyclic phosphodiesterase
MLQVGPYPYHLKQRILGDRGHLSNERAGQLLCKLLHEGLQAVMLGHLSKENNLPELAYEAVRVEVTLAQKGVDEEFFSECTMKPSDLPMTVASRSEPSPVIRIA